MVLIRKHYFVQHLESLQRRQRSRTLIENHLFRFIRPWKQPRVEVVGPTPANTFHEPASRFNAQEGIGAALVGGGSAGIGLGIALAAPVPKSFDTDASANTTAAGHTNEEMQSPKSYTASFDVIHHHDSSPGIVADAQSFTSSPRSGAAPLPFSPGGQSTGRAVYTTTTVSPRAIRYRRGQFMREPSTSQYR